MSEERDKMNIKVNVLALLVIVFILGFISGKAWLMSGADVLVPNTGVEASYRPLAEEHEACVMDDAYRLTEQ